MRKTRIIARLDIKNSNLIKSINLEGLKIVGNPHDFSTRYYEEGIDELLLIDCVATLYGRNNLFEIIKNISKDVFIPITVGGGIRSLDDVKKILQSGADKVAINTAAVKKPDFISKVANSIGSQSLVLSIEAKKKANNKWEDYTSNGRDPSKIDVVEWINQASELGAGEILLTSIDQEGTRKGFDLDLVKEVSEITDIPIIISGGLGKKEHLLNLNELGSLDAIAIADALHYKRISVQESKKTLLI